MLQLTNGVKQGGVLSPVLFIRLEARLQPNIGFTLRRVLAMSTCSAITSPKVNRFDGGWPWQIFGRDPQYSSDSRRARRICVDNLYSPKIHNR